MTEHTPGPMRLITAVEIAANAARRWREQYSNWSDDNKFHDGTTKGEIDNLLDRTSHTPEGIASVINKGWAYPQCSSCGEYYDVVVNIQRDWSDQQMLFCRECLSHALTMLGPNP